MAGTNNEALANEIRPDLTEPEVNRYLPLAINMAGLRCLVVGGGQIGGRKACRLAAAGAKVTVLSPCVSDRVRELAARGQIQWIQAEYNVSYLDDFVLVVAATREGELNARIGRDAETRRILCCVASSADVSRAIFPAVFTDWEIADEEITIAVHSNGRNCRVSQEVRDGIASWLHEARQARAGFVCGADQVTENVLTSSSLKPLYSRTARGPHGRR